MERAVNLEPMYTCLLQSRAYPCLLLTETCFKGVTIDIHFEGEHSHCAVFNIVLLSPWGLGGCFALKSISQVLYSPCMLFLQYTNRSSAAILLPYDWFSEILCPQFHEFTEKSCVATAKTKMKRGLFSNQCFQCSVLMLCCLWLFCTLFVTSFAVHFAV